VTLREIVLASASPRRLEILRSLRLIVKVLPSTYDEPEFPELTPRETAAAHARAKCTEVGSRVGGVIVAADTVVDLDGTAYGKPNGAADARRTLRALSGRTHLVHTAFCVLLPGRSAPVEHEETTRVTFFPLDQDEIDAYAASGEPLDKAGSYGIQGYGATLVERIDGDFYTVMGFPLAQFVRSLRRLGIALPITKEDDTTLLT
jgi:septum formation protein